MWVGGAIRLHSAKGAFIPRPIAAHWDGRTWTVTELPGGSAHKDNLTLSLAQDGNGGIWATGNCPSCQKFAPQLMWHWQHGRWTGPSKGPLLDAKTHANYVTLAQVGHTSSVWAVGTVFSKPASGRSPSTERSRTRRRKPARLIERLPALSPCRARIVARGNPGRH